MYSMRLLLSVRYALACRGVTDRALRYQMEI
jgi:hypothetical protein